MMLNQTGRRTSLFIHSPVPVKSINLKASQNVRTDHELDSGLLQSSHLRLERILVHISQ